MRHPFALDAVAAVFAEMPEDRREGSLCLRDLIFDIAAGLPQIGHLSEELRWGQPAYLTPEVRAGSTLRVGPAKGGGFALFAHCQTTIIRDFANAFPGMDDIKGNRAIRFRSRAEIEAGRHGLLIRSALTYHL